MAIKTIMFGGTSLLLNQLSRVIMYWVGMCNRLAISVQVVNPLRRNYHVCYGCLSFSWLLLDSLTYCSLNSVYFQACFQPHYMEAYFKFKALMLINEADS